MVKIPAPISFLIYIIVPIVILIIISIILNFAGILKINFSFNKELKNIPKPVNKFLTEKEVSQFESKGFTIYRGDNPPNVEGTYALADYTIKYDPGTWEGAYPIGYKLASYVVTLSDQKEDGSISFSTVSEEADDRAQGIGAFISGENNCFTIYMYTKGEIGDCKYEWPELIAGCIDADGIKNYKSTYMMRTKSGPSCESEVMPIGYLRVAEEEDGLADRQ